MSIFSFSKPVATACFSAVVLIVSGFVSKETMAAQGSQNITGPDSVDSLLEKDKRRLRRYRDNWDLHKSQIYADTGLKFGFDYNALGLWASGSLGETDASSGAFRAFGRWDLSGEQVGERGSMVFKFEHRHAYTDVPPFNFGSETGYAGLLNTVYSDQGFRTSTLYWRQEFDRNRGLAFFGFLDVTDYTDIFAFGSPWQSFGNMAFESGSGTIGGLPDGAFGFMLGKMLTPNIYVVGGMVDANADATDISQGFQTFFEQFETFKSFDIGYTSGRDELFLNNWHVSFWQIDKREQAGRPSGWGVSFSASSQVKEVWQPFFRGGWSDGGGASYDASVSIGFGYVPASKNYLLGVGLNWASPSEEEYGDDVRNQWTSELFYRFAFSPNTELTLSMQILLNPALDNGRDSIVLPGLRFRGAF
ncbi:hypothetical protein [Alteromonas aestuariivivens]|nr:hypothetical protein [Alteromonas aestuariivivens]